MNCLYFGDFPVMRTVLRPGLILCVLASASLSAQAADPLASMRECAKQTDDARRLACYDTVMKADTVTPQATSAAAAVAAPAAAGAEETFGYRGSVAREDLDREEAAKPKLEKLTSQVTAVTMQPHGEFVITLSNEQVWTQKRPDNNVKPKVGDSVTIKPGTFGSFLLVTETGRSTQVSRVR
jgi:hypothetical protein